MRICDIFFSNNFRCKQLQENQDVAWFLETKGKYSPKQETLVFLETTVRRVWEKAENQQKTREKSIVTENQVIRLDFCAIKRTVHIPSEVILGQVSTGFEQTRLKTIARLSAPL
jgi:hypothetical protein